MLEFLKELWTMTKMLFESKPSNFEELELMETNYFPFGEADYLTWCGKCVYRKTNRTITCHPSKYVINHEHIHLAQAKDCGSWFRFYIAYLLCWLKTFPPFSNKAYYLNKFEIEAYAKEQDLNYLEHRTIHAVDNFDFPEKYKLWKESADEHEFKAYIKIEFN